jgi:hypothetical protein
VKAKAFEIVYGLNEINFVHNIIEMELFAKIELFA